VAVYDDQDQKNLNRITGISDDEEAAMDREAHNGAAQDIADREKSADGSATSPSSQESSEQSALPTGNTSSPWSTKLGGGNNKNVNKIVKALQSRKALAGGGGVGALIVILITMSGLMGSFEAIHARENMLGNKGNGVMNTVLQQRRGRSLARQLRKIAKNPAANTLDKAKFKEKFEKAGFKGFDEEGNVKNLEYTDKEGTTHALDLNDDPNISQKANDASFSERAKTFFSHDEISVAFEEATSTKATLWKGPFAREMFTKKLNIGFGKWIKDKFSDKAKTPKDEFTESYREANTKGSADPRVSGAQENLSDEQKAGGQTADNGIVDTAEVEAAKQKVLADPTISYSEALDGVDPKAMDKFLETSEGAIKNGSSESIQAAAQAVAKDSPSFAKSAAPTVGLAINALQIPTIACRIKGTIAFIGNARVRAVTVELAKLATRFLVVTDRQKAGIIQEGEMNIMMAYMHSPNPTNGKTYANAGGFQNVILGNQAAAPSSLDQAKYTVSRFPEGFLGTANDYVNNIPGLNPAACKIITNGFVQIGGAAIGIAASIYTGGGFAATNIAVGVGLAAVQEGVFFVGEKVASASMAGMTIDGHESGEAGGDAMASGWGSLKAMDGSANGLKLATKSQFALLQSQTDAANQRIASKQSILERYLNINNPDSLASNVAYASVLKLNPAYASANLSSFLTSNPFSGAFSNILGSGKASAQAAEKNCKDPQIVKYNLATDVFCNPQVVHTPDLDTDQTERLLAANSLIDSTGQPTGEFKDYVDACFSGGASLLYNPSVDKNSGEPATLDQCAEGGSPLPGETTGVGRYERFTDYYGYLVDTKNTEEDINETYTGTTTQVTAAATGPVSFTWPTDEKIAITDCFGPRGGAFHPGVDMPGPMGTPIKAAADGVVTFAGVLPGGPNKNYGPNFVIIKHANDFSTSYGHMNSMSVKQGDVVKQHQQIGEMGTRGESTGPHLHFNVFPGDYKGSDKANVNPLANGLILPSPANNPIPCPTTN
jgi:murein DD-endopeptidase MepM/ murein hydrolase activator NlpD